MLFRVLAWRAQVLWGKVMNRILVFLLIIGCSQTSVDEGKSSLFLSILHTNDHHGHYLKDDKGQYGMAARSTLVNQIRRELNEKGHAHLLLSGGDINTGTMESDLFDAEPDFKGMKQLGYDAMAVGNHEFDNAFEVIEKQRGWAGFPFLSANVFYKNTNKHVFNPLYIIKEFKGYRVGIFGLTTFDTPAVASHQDAQQKFDFKPIIPEAKKVVAKLRDDEKVDLVIVVTHVGHDGSPTSNGDVALAKAVDGIDVIVGGHSQEIINAEIHNGAVIVQAEDWGKYVGRLDLKFTESGKEMLNYKLIPVNLQKSGKLIGEKIEEDYDFIKLFKPYKDKADKLSMKKLSTIDKTLGAKRELVRTQQMPVAQFVGAAMIEQVPQIEVGVLNGGSLRNPLSAGKITRKELHKLHPYGNTIIRVEMTDKELFAYMEEMTKLIFKAKESPLGGYPQLINMRLKIKDQKLQEISSVDGKWSIKKADDKVLSNKKSFVFGTLNFLARGGDNYPILNDKKSYVDTGFMINTALMNYSEKRKGGLKKADFEKMNPKALEIN